MYKLIQKKATNLKDDILSGLTVSLALVPEAVAFSFVAGVDPLVGLYTAFIIGLITSIFGGRPGMISGATGAVAVVVTELVASKGIEYLFVAAIVMGIIQILAGVLKYGRFIRLVPYPVMIGFVNGLAMIIFISQFEQFKVGHEWLSGSELYTMIGLIFLTMVIIKFAPKYIRSVPSTLISIVVVTLLVVFLDIHTRTVSDLASISGGLPMFHLPEVPFNLDTLMTVLPYSAVMATIGLIESLMTMSLIDEITETRGNGNKECIGQGLANIVTGFFGGMGGCAMIGQSMININSGGKRRASGITAALSLIAMVLFGSKLISMIPIAALVGVMFMVVIGTFEWATFSILNKIPTSDAIVILLVSVVTVFTNLAVSVAVGIIVSALVFAWNKGKKITSEVIIEEDGTKIHILDGPLFFGSVKNFLDLFKVNDDPDLVIIDFSKSRIYDHSAIEAINSLTSKYANAGKQIRLKHLSSECKDLLNNAEHILEVNPGMLEIPATFAN